VAGIENPEKVLGQQFEPGYLTLKQATTAKVLVPILLITDNGYKKPLEKFCCPMIVSMNR
jgi:hypothetical protein